MFLGLPGAPSCQNSRLGTGAFTRWIQVDFLHADALAMPPRPVIPLLPVHPHQIEVQEFSAYALIVDLRPGVEYQRDHIPGAVSAPWAPAAVRTTGTGASALVAAEPSADLPVSLMARLAELQPDDVVLVYGATGGRDAAALAPALRRRGVTVDVLLGGWDNYRRWVTAAIEILPRVLSLLAVRSPVALVPLLTEALMQLGQQVVTLADLPADLPQGSALVDALRRMDPARPVWIVATDDGEQALPAPLHDGLRHAPALRVVGVGAEATVAPDTLRAERETVLRLASMSTGAAVLALQALPDPWPGRLLPDPDQSNP